MSRLNALYQTPLSRHFPGAFLTLSRNEIWESGRNRGLCSGAQATKNRWLIQMCCVSRRFTLRCHSSRAAPRGILSGPDVFGLGYHTSHFHPRQRQRPVDAPRRVLRPPKRYLPQRDASSRLPGVHHPGAVAGRPRAKRPRQHGAIHGGSPTAGDPPDGEHRHASLSRKCSEGRRRLSTASGCRESTPVAHPDDPGLHRLCPTKKGVAHPEHV